jgi:folate-dependent phosphoribosylglycinamide formyltransferase PurN
MTPARLSPGALRVADSLRTSTAGLAAVIGVRSVAPGPGTPIGSLRRYAGAAWRKLRARAAGAPSQNAREYAMRHGIACKIVSVANRPQTAETLARERLEVVVSYGAGLLRPVLLDIPGVAFLNAHAGRLPKYGGMNVVEWAVFNDDPIWGTVHRIDRGIDTGEILVEAPLAVGQPRTIRDLRSAAFTAVWDMVPEALGRLSRGELRFRRQPEDQPRIQWFRMHEVLLRVVEEKLESGSFDAVQERSLIGSARGTS